MSAKFEPNLLGITGVFPGNVYIIYGITWKKLKKHFSRKK